jgi:hypothetical protein
MSTLQTQVSFTVPTTNNDGSPITEALSYLVFIDTVNPPVKSYPVPAAAAPVAGVLTVKFTDLGFTPVPGTDYFAAADDSDADGTSPLSNIVSFNYGVVPNAPTGFSVG